MNDTVAMTLTEVAEALQRGEISPTEAVKACLNQIELTEPKIGALLTIDDKGAQKAALDLEKEGPNPTRPLWGVPLIIKDAISTKDLRTTSASKILEDFIPIYDAYVIRRLKEAGAIILAKANLDEFAMGSSTENSAFQKTHNPWDISKSPGGSSGGSAASVAAHQAFASLGSDTGGSIRQPAAFCGCVGLKPTYGRVSRFGLFAFASSMDQIGPLARSVKDCAALLNIIAGHDPRDNTSSPVPVDDYLAQLGRQANELPLTNRKIGFPEDFFGSGLHDDVRNHCMAALSKAQKLGAELVRIKLPDPDIATATYYVLSMAEASSNLARYDGVKYGRRASGVSTLEELYFESRTQGFGQEVKRRIMLGSYVLSAGYYDAYFRKAAQVRRIIFDSYRKALQECDVIAMPVAPVPAWDLGSHELDPLRAYLMDAYTLPANLAGLPGISLPVGLGEQSHMPIGMQLIGKPFCEAELLKISHDLETVLPKIGSPKFGA